MAVQFEFSNGDVLVLDAAVSQHHERNADVTKHPVEKGADITDHIRPLPNTLNIVGVISATPVTFDGAAPEPNLHKAAFELLDKAMINKFLVTVRTGLKVYQNMAIKHIAYPRESGGTLSLNFTIELVEIRFATTATATVDKNALGPKTPTGPAPGAGKTQLQAPGAVSRGSGVPKALTPATNKAAAAAAGKVQALAKPKTLFKYGATFLKTGHL